jgi:hypothetical protein
MGWFQNQKWPDFQTWISSRCHWLCHVHNWCSIWFQNIQFNR